MGRGYPGRRGGAGACRLSHFLPAFECCDCETAKRVQRMKAFLGDAMSVRLLRITLRQVLCFGKDVGNATTTKKAGKKNSKKESSISGVWVLWISRITKKDMGTVLFSQIKFAGNQNVPRKENTGKTDRKPTALPEPGRETASVFPHC